MVLVWQITDDSPNLPNFPAIQYTEMSKVQHSVWVKPRAQECWNTIKAGELGENWWMENLRMTKTA